MTAEPPADQFVCGIILAAGASQRMGRPKQLLPLGDRPVLQHVVDAAAASRLDQLILVLGCRADEIRDALALPEPGRIEIVEARDFAEGQSISLRAGLLAADPRASAAAVLLGDQPGVGADLIDRVAEVFAEGDAPVVRPLFTEGGVPGHPVILARSIWPELKALRADQGARALLAAHPEWLATVAVEGRPAIDLDTWEDYLWLRDAWAAPAS